MKRFIISFFALTAIVSACFGNFVPAVALLFAPTKLSANLGAAELLKRLFHTEIQPKLFPSNSFLARAMNDDAFVNNNSVELPHSGTIPAVTVDRGTLPATIAKRTDAATNYVLEELTTDPTLIGESEGLIIAYNKRASVLDQHANEINKKAASRALFAWAGGTNTAGRVASSGASRAVDGSSSTQTGNRKKFTVDDILKIKTKFHKDDVVNENVAVSGIAIFTPAQLSDLLSIQSIYDASMYGKGNLPDGVVARILGFDVYVRSSTVVLDSTDALKAEGAAAAATDQDAAVFYHPNFVRRAVGAIKPFINEDKAEYYGSLFSMLVRFGAAPARNDNKGIYLLFEDNV